MHTRASGKKMTRKQRIRRMWFRRIRALAVLALLIWLIVFGITRFVGCIRETPANPAQSPGIVLPEEDAQPSTGHYTYVVDPYAAVSYESMNRDIAELEAMYPDLVHSFSIGESVEGRKISAFTLGKGEITIIFTGSIHGCESFTTDFLLYLADRYAYGYVTDGELGGLHYRALLDRVTFLIVPMLNPDGVNIAQNGPAAAADPDAVEEMDLTGTGHYAWKANANGVDLNRNFPFNWSWDDTSTEYPAARYYPGPYAASEPETRAMIALLETTEFEMFVDFHIHGEVIYWNDNGPVDLSESMRPIVERLFDATGYEEAGEEDVSEFGGFLQNFVKNTYGKFSITVELADRSPYDEQDFDRAIDDGVYMIGLILADEAIKAADSR